MHEIERVAILGAGAMGATLASRLSAAPGFSTCLIARGERRDRLMKTGLTVNEETFFLPVIDPAGAQTPMDLILVGLKHHQLPEAVPGLGNLVGSETTFISVMNGLDSETYIGGLYGMDKVLICISVGIDALRQEGKVTYTTLGKLQFGEADNTQVSDRVTRVQSALDRAGIPHETPTDMLRVLWWKFMINVGVNQDWRNVPLRRLLEDRYGIPVHLANDCQVAALGEYTFGDNDGVQNLVVISVGWGIGAGIVLNGQLLHGNPLGAGEIGHVSVVENGELCRCGHFGCLETVAGAQAIVQQVRELVRNRPGRPPESGPEEITFAEVCRMFHAGDLEVRQIMRTAGRGLGIAAANMIGTLGGCQIRLAGLLTCIGPFLLDVMRAELSKRTLAALAEKTHVDFASLGDDIIIRGAAAMLLTQELGVFQLPGHPL